MSKIKFLLKASLKGIHPGEWLINGYKPTSLKGTFTPSKPKDTTNEQTTRNTTTIILRSPNLYGLRSYSGLHSHSIIGD